MPNLSHLLKPVALASAVVLVATSLQAAPEDGIKSAPKAPKRPAEIMIRIPHEPDTADNGCRLRASPAEAKPAPSPRFRSGAWSITTC